MDYKQSVDELRSIYTILIQGYQDLVMKRPISLQDLINNPEKLRVNSKKMIASLEPDIMSLATVLRNEVIGYLGSNADIVKYAIGEERAKEISSNFDKDLDPDEGFISAANIGSEKAMQYFFDQGIESKDNVMSQALIIAAKNGDFPTIKFIVALIKSYTPKIPLYNPEGKINIPGEAIVLAASQNRLDIIKFFIENSGSNITNSIAEGAGIRAHYDILKYLINSDPKNEHDIINYALSGATKGGKIDFMKYLQAWAKSKGDVYLYRQSLLIDAAENNQVEAFKLVKSWYNSSHDIYNGYRISLKSAASNGSNDIIELLKTIPETGIDIDTIYEALQGAANYNQVKTFKILERWADDLITSQIDLLTVAKILVQSIDFHRNPVDIVRYILDSYIIPVEYLNQAFLKTYNLEILKLLKARGATDVQGALNNFFINYSGHDPKYVPTLSQLIKWGGVIDPDEALKLVGRLGGNIKDIQFVIDLGAINIEPAFVEAAKFNHIITLKAIHDLGLSQDYIQDILSDPQLNKRLSPRVKDLLKSWLV